MFKNGSSGGKSIESMLVLALIKQSPETVPDRLKKSRPLPRIITKLSVNIYLS